ncbi:hypothetical protein ARSEF1564_003399 [Beauveria bassiana]
MNKQSALPIAPAPDGPSSATLIKSSKAESQVEHRQEMLGITTEQEQE